jgi:lysyl-tRNA synthetase class II
MAAPLKAFVTHHNAGHALFLRIAVGYTSNADCGLRDKVYEIGLTFGTGDRPDANEFVTRVHEAYADYDVMMGIVERLLVHA